MMLEEHLGRPLPHRSFISSSTPSFPTFASSNGNPNPNFSPPPSPSPSSKNPRLSSSSSSSSFSHNPRIAIALVPSALFLLDLGGTPVAATLTITLMISYILDSLRLKSASFFGVWFSLIASQIAFFFSSSAALSAFPSLPLSILAFLLCAETNFLVGVWASLQFRWIQIENPSIVPALERLLFACIPLAVPALFSWAAVSAVGLTVSASYYYAAFSCLFFWLFSLPRASSFKPRPARGSGSDLAPRDDSLILFPLESCIHTLHILFFPLLFHLASHHSVALSSPASVCDLLLLFFLPFLFLLYASTRGALWWVTKDEHQLQRIRVVNGAVALVVVVICLEIRVVFHSFARYMQVPAPLNYLLVTIAMLGGASAVGAHALGMVNDAFSSVAFTALSVLVSAAGAIVVGFPIYVSIWTLQ